jgi:glutamate dehydrogenase
MLDRGIEYLPSTDDMNERARTGAGMATPELATLLAYAKRSLRQWLLDSELPDWGDFADVIKGYFPRAVVERFGDLIADHPLRRELVATIVANRVVNSEGVTFVTRLMAETGAAPEQVVRSYHIARDVINATERWRDVEALVGTIPADLARRLMVGIDELVESVARWYLTNPTNQFMSAIIATAKPDFEQLDEMIAQSGPAQWRSERDELVGDLMVQGVPEKLAHRHIYQQELVHAPDMIEVAHHTNRSVKEVADVFLLAGAAFEIDWLESQLALLPIANRWQRRAIQTVEDDLVLLRRQLAENIFSEAESSDPHTALEHYLVARTHELGRLTRFMRDLAGDGVTDVAAVIVAIRQIRNLAT